MTIENSVFSPKKIKLTLELYQKFLNKDYWIYCNCLLFEDKNGFDNIYSYFDYY